MPSIEKSTYWLPVEVLYRDGVELVRIKGIVDFGLSSRSRYLHSRGTKNVRIDTLPILWRRCPIPIWNPPCRGGCGIALTEFSLGKLIRRILNMLEQNLLVQSKERTMPRKEKIRDVMAETWGPWQAWTCTDAIPANVWAAMNS
jgi:hypothetical protein